MMDFVKNIISIHKSIREGLEQLNDLSGSNNLTLFVLNEKEQLVGTLTDGDIRRGLLQGKSINDSIEVVMHTNFRYLKKKSFSISEIKSFKDQRIHIVPLLDENGRILKIVDLREQPSLLPLDAVIMAGGVGQRLRPYTEKVPKPLLKVGKKPIIEHNIDRLIRFGVSRIFISIGYLGDQIKEYLGDGSEKNIQIEYIQEDKPLGTIGALKLIKNIEHDQVLVMNSDLLTNVDYENFFQQFEDDKAEISIASIPYKVDIPYAVFQVEDNFVLSLKEKPSYTYYSNAGIYIIKKDVINLIPDGQFYNATDFIENLIALKKRVTQYPILEYWLDIGKLEDFKKAQEDIKHLKL